MSSFAGYYPLTQDAVFARATQAPARTLFATYTPSLVGVSGVIPQRIEGGSPMYKRNTAAKVPFKAVDSSGNGLAGLTVTAKTGKDGANPTTATNAVVESGGGWYYITLTATEMNGEIVVLDASATGATIAPVAIYTENDYTAARAAYLDAAISSRSTYAGGAVASVTAGVTVSTNNDKSGYALSSAGVQAIWDALTSALSTVGSIGKRIADYLTGDAFARLGAPAGASIAADIATRSTYAGADTAGTTTLLGRLTSTRAGNLDNLDAAVSSRLASGSYTAPDNASVAAIKAKTDNIPSDPADASDIADAFTGVANTLTTIAGYIDTEVAAIKAKTDNLPADPADASDIASAFGAVGSAIAAVDTKLGTPAASVADDVAAVKADTAAVKAKTDQLAFTNANQVDANIHAVNDVNVRGTGAPGDTWGPP
ncbi:MAG TPA: hypothetical protein VJN68_14075 [Burkholderiaceae bacterium]|nr:hypothetical protein [Burkholderiaceae bacterium]